MEDALAEPDFNWGRTPAATWFELVHAGHQVTVQWDDGEKGEPQRWSPGMQSMHFARFAKAVPGALASTSSDLQAVRQRLAVVIGISQYAHRGKWDLADLRHAATDARALEGFLNADQAGFDAVELLVDRQATAVNVKRALREKLRGVQPDDLVMIFWAGHGFSDPHEPDKLYLITHDTDPQHMASTAYAMDDFRSDIANIRAGRVIVIADACHSGGIFDPTIGIRGRRENTIVSSLRGVYVSVQKGVGEATPGGANSPLRLIFSSCEQGEVARESEKLGHGVFTYYLLQALKGEADRPENKTGGNGDGKVSLGEMIEYTRDQVKRFTENQQHPATAGQFDRNLPIGSAK
ncbi:MAG: caspase family protein [Planctomycetota bacterium]|nr:caspase family protein [Planctomycetota bacterium]